MRKWLEQHIGNADPLWLKLRGGDVRRYHTEGACFDQNTAEHQWRATVLLLHLWPDASRELVLWVLQHDIAEGVLGDLPAPIKRLDLLNGDYFLTEARVEEYLGVSCHLSAFDRARAKIVDYLELCYYCCEVPYPRARAVFHRGIGYVGKGLEGVPHHDRLKVSELIGELKLRRAKVDGELRRE